MKSNILQDVLGDSLSRHRDRVIIEYGETFITYAEFDKRSDYIAHWLLRRGMGRERFVGILAADRVEFISAMIGILKAGCAFVPLDPTNPPDRLDRLIELISLDFLFIDREYRGYAGHCSKENRKIDFAVLDDLFNDRQNRDGQERPKVEYTPEDKIYVYFTSGTTGRPRAIIGKNRSLLHYCRWEIDTFQAGKGVRMSQFATTSDAFLKEIFVTFLSGGTLCIPLDFKRILTPEALRDWVERSNINIIHCVPHVFRILSGGKLAPSRFPHLKYVVLSGEKIFPSDLKYWYETLDERIRIVNLYGTTETTILNTCYFIHKEDADRSRVPVGTPIRGNRVIILDENMNICSRGAAGEIYIRTPYRSFGYCNNPGLTGEKFIKNPFNKDPDDILFKTGDFGRFLPDGNIELLGRVDRQVKVRGHRIEPEEIERELVKHPMVREAVVVRRETTKNIELLFAYVVGDIAGECSPDVLKEYLSTRLPDYMVPAYIIDMGELPRKPNRKIDYDLLPDPFQAKPTDALPPRDEIEGGLLEIWSDILGMKKIGVRQDFFEMGGSSLNVMSLAYRIHREFDVKMSFGEMFENPTIESQAERIKAKRKEMFIRIQAVEKKEFYPLSSAQKRLYILQEFEEGNIHYNETAVFLLSGDLDPDRLEQAFGRLIERHESFRTSFQMVGEEPVQRIHDAVLFEIEYARGGTICRSGDGNMGRDLIKNFIRHFDLSRAPLLRVGLVNLGEGENILIVDMHHIISDATSISLLAREFTALYRGEELTGLRIQYKDYGEWQYRGETKVSIEAQQEYWLTEFDGRLCPLNLPLDYPRPEIQEFEGAQINFEIGAEEAAALREFSLAEGASLFMVLLALANVLLSKLTGQEEVVVGTPIANRSHADLEPLIGMFVNTLVLRNFPAGDRTFTGFVREVKARTMRAFENQDYQFEDLVEKVVTTRDASRNPLFDVMFVFQNVDMQPGEIPGLTFTPYDFEDGISRFDMTLQGFESEGKLCFILEYCTGLFLRETIGRFIKYFKRIVTSVIGDYEIELAAVDMIPGAEKQRLLADCLNTGGGSPAGRGIHELFEDQEKCRPNQAALMFQESQLTYSELNRRANQLAARLKREGAAPDSIIGIRVPASLALAVGLLGIMKAGGAYLPLAVDYPDARIRYMLRDCGVELVLTDCERGGLPLSLPPNIAVMDVTDKTIYLKDGMNVKQRFDASRLAYVIYTSGTTGKPKGVAVAHRSVVNMLSYRVEEYRLQPGVTALQLFSCSFDGFVTGFFTPLLSGARVILLAEEARKDILKIKEAICKNRVSHFISVPVLYRAIIDNLSKAEAAALSVVTLAGDRLPPDILSLAASRGIDIEIVHEYGVTEASVLSTLYRHQERERRIKIGRPIWNTGIYIIDKYWRLQPVGVPGEMCVGGVGVAGGYLNNLSLTGERFIENPFRPGDRLYRTGDLARWLPGGEIEFLGRIDDQVKIRGFRIEPAEIEESLLEIGEIRQAVVVAKQSPDGEKYLCAYITAPEKMDAAFLKEFLEKRLPGYMIPRCFGQLDKIPLTVNEKIDRRALPDLDMPASTAEYAAPTDAVEKKLVDIWSAILKIERDHIGTLDNFYELGGHSLNVIQVIAKIHRIFNVKVPVAEVFKMPTIKGLSRYIKGTAEDKYEEIRPAEKKSYYALSPAQRRLYFIQQIETSSTAYNLPQLITMAEKPEVEMVRETIGRLVGRHESLRTSFHMIREEPVQRIHQEVDFEIEYYDSRSPDDGPTCYIPQDITRRFIRPFDLSRVPLFRVGFLRTDEDRLVLLIDMHHIVTDGVSHGILLQCFEALYRGRQLPPLKVQYKDYSEWQNAEQGRGCLQKQQDFWLATFGGDIPVLDLPTDYPRSEEQSFAGDVIYFDLGAGLTERIMRRVRETGVTLSIFLLAAYAILLSKYSGQEDIVVGIPTAGRRHEDLQKIIGMFVNMLAIRSRPAKGRPFKTFLEEVKKRSIDAYENQDYQYDDLVLRLGLQGDRNRNPLFDTVFVFQSSGENDGGGRPRLTFAPSELKNQKFDLILEALEGFDNIDIVLSYSTALFKRSTAEGITKHYIDILSQVTGDMGLKLGEIGITHDFLTAAVPVFSEEQKGFRF
jgi:amino acid adenylation domain-containing protein